MAYSLPLTFAEQRSDQQALQTKQQDLYSSQRISVKSALSAENYQVEKGTTILKYPNKMLDNNTDYVIFGFYAYDPPFGRANGGDGNIQPDSGDAGYDLYAKSGIGKKRIRGMDPILLYMPEDIQGQYSAQWQGTGFGAAAAGLARTVGTDFEGIATAFKSIPGVAKNAMFKKEIGAINKVTGANISLNQLTGTVSGTIMNPNTEMTYEAPEMRGFTLHFKMTPSNGVESKTIRKICNRFKKAMLPRFGGQAIFGTVNSPNLLSIPALCQVNFMSGNKMNEYLPQYKLCAITDVSINYTPDGSYATYGDTSPVATVLKVTFKETKLLFSDEINEDGVSF